MNIIKANKSWKTTAAGVAAIIGALCSHLVAEYDDDPNTKASAVTTISAIAAGVGLLSARDNNKTSEDVGAKPKPAVDLDKLRKGGF